MNGRQGKLVAVLLAAAILLLAAILAVSWDTRRKLDAIGPVTMFHEWTDLQGMKVHVSYTGRDEVEVLNQLDTATALQLIQHPIR